jgi:hypothetical protein
VPISVSAGSGVIDTAIRVRDARGDSRGNKGSRCEEGIV